MLLDPGTRSDLQPAPGAPSTIAVTLGTNDETPDDGPLAIYDNGVKRPTQLNGFDGTPTDGNSYDSLQWGADTSTLFAADDSDTGLDFYTLAVNSSGVTLTAKEDDPSARLEPGSI